MNIALITGANRGIGLAITKTLLKNNYKVIAVSKSVNNLHKINNNNLIVYKCNLTNNDELELLLEYITTQKINILINNAGIGKFGNTLNFNYNDWNEIITLNLTVPFMLIKSVISNMKELGFGKIINICSDASYLGFDEAAAYCASKHGLYGLGKALSIELKKYGITVSSICPGRVDTFFNNKNPGDRPNALKDCDIADLILNIIQYENRCNIETVMLSSSNE